MALLYRFSRLNDRYHSCVYTFIVTRSVLRDPHRDATTKDFAFGHHKWALTFPRSETTLGVLLVMRNPSAGTRCYVDFSISLLNREHFSHNEVYSEKGCKFGADKAMRGTPARWITLSDLKTKKFTDENCEFLLELQLGNATTVFEGEVKMPDGNQQQKPSRLETEYFTFGAFEWNVSIDINQGDAVFWRFGARLLAAASKIFYGSPYKRNTSKQGRPRVLLNRLTGFEHQCRVVWRAVIYCSRHSADSGRLDQISDVQGRIRGFSPPLPPINRRSAAPLRVRIELHTANAVSEARVALAARDPAPNCYDRDRAGWCVEADAETEFLRLKLFFADLASVPRNHLKAVAWNAYVVRDGAEGNKESVIVQNAPHQGYYVQDGVDMGVVMETDIPVSQIRESTSAYLENKTHLTVHIEWLESVLLFSALYHKYDDVARIHGHQMKREITALHFENYSLERQLYSYQKSLAQSRSKPPSEHSEQLEEEEDYTDDHYNHDHYGERGLTEAQSLSETEYP